MSKLSKFKLYYEDEPMQPKNERVHIKTDYSNLFLIRFIKYLYTKLIRYMKEEV